MKTFLFLITKGCSHVKGLPNAWAVYQACVSIWHLGDINTCLNVTLSLDRTPRGWGGDSAALCLPCLSPLKIQWKTLHSGPCLPRLKQKIQFLSWEGRHNAQSPWSRLLPNSSGMLETSGNVGTDVVSSGKNYITQKRAACQQVPSLWACSQWNLLSYMSAKLQPSFTLILIA